MCKTNCTRSIHVDFATKWQENILLTFIVYVFIY